VVIAVGDAARSSDEGIFMSAAFRSFAFAGVLALAACATDPGAEPLAPSPAQQGRLIAQQQCSRCHAIGELGASPRADAPPLREVLDAYVPDRLRLSFEEGLMIGHPDMPLFRFEPAEVDALIAYLRSID
jgi:mono/diheme cytochrome c family protein